VAVAERERRIRVHPLGREQAAAAELRRHAGADVSELGADDLLAGGTGQVVFEARERSPVEAAGDRADTGLRVVSEDGDQPGGRAQAFRHLAHQVVEQGRAGRPCSGERDAMQRLSVCIPAFGIAPREGHAPV